MKALKCDNCGGSYDYLEKGPTKIEWRSPVGDVHKKYDLCPECMAAVCKTLDDRKNLKVSRFEDDLK